MPFTRNRSSSLTMVTASIACAAGLACSATAQLRDFQGGPDSPTDVHTTTPPHTPLNPTRWPVDANPEASRPAPRRTTGGNARSGAQNNRQPTPAQERTRSQGMFVTLPELQDAFADDQNNQDSEPGNTPPSRRFRLFGEMDGLGLPGLPDNEPAAPALTQITSTFEGADFDPQISRDGRFIVYASTQHRETSDIYLRHTHGSVITRITSDPGDDVMPTISPEGNRIAFTSNRAGNWDLYVMPASGGRAIQLTTTPEHEIHPSWSPDGTSLVFSRFGQNSGRWEMWVTNVDNPSTSRFIGYGLFPEWCPVPGTGYAGGDRILFQRSRERGDRAFTIWSLEYNDGVAGNLTEIIASPTDALINPTWSPDGNAVIFASMPLEIDDDTDPNNTPSDLWMIGIDGIGRTSLTAGDSIDLMPTWGNDGRVYFVSNRSGRDNLWALDVSEVIRTARGAAPWSSQTPEGNEAIADGSNSPNSDPRSRVFQENAGMPPANATSPGADPVAAFRQQRPQNNSVANAPTDDQ